MLQNKNLYILVSPTQLNVLAYKYRSLTRTILAN